MSKATIKTGDTFVNNQGCKFEVIDYLDKKNILIEFKDKHKHQMFTRSDRIREGVVKNPYHPNVFGIGYVGVGEFNCRKNKTLTREYIAWRAMLERCYSERALKRCPTYKDCTVCESWLNFQNFAEWYTSQKHCYSNYQVDKDLLVDGNTEYSPSKCVLAPPQINSLILDGGSSTSDLPIGVSRHKRDNIYVAGFAINGKRVHLGYFDTVEQASQAYQVAKKANIKRMALEWQDRIDKRLFNALMARAA